MRRTEENGILADNLTIDTYMTTLHAEASSRDRPDRKASLLRLSAISLAEGYLLFARSENTLSHVA
jgi:hypothetical protein